MQPLGWWPHPAWAIVAVEADRDQERGGRDGEHAHDRPPSLDLPARAREALLSNSPLGTARALLTTSAWASPCWRRLEGHPPGRASRPSPCRRPPPPLAALRAGPAARQAGARQTVGEGKHGTHTGTLRVPCLPPPNGSRLFGVMLQRVSLALLLPALARSEDYVAFQALSNTNLPPARALSATVLQHTVSANAALGRCVPSVA